MRLVPLTLVLVALLDVRPVHADARAEMTAALQAQADTEPAPARLPVTLPAAPRAASTPVKPVTPRAPVAASSRAAAGHFQQLLIGLSTALARQTQAAAQSAAGQAQSQAAKERATRNPRN